jgi:DNA-binding response OmpR family regulator
MWKTGHSYIKSKMAEEADDKAHPEMPLVLIVEDDHDISRLLSMMLEKEGYRFHQAFSYQEAVHKIQNHHYSAVTLDLMIPGGSGLTLLSELRGNEATVNLPVIVVSAKANEGKLEVEGAAFSMVDWIEKPIDENRLLESIRSAMSHAIAKGGRLLHVEDDLDIATIVDTLLGDEFQVVHATTLKQARQRVSEEVFDLVLLDIGLPDGSGLELIPTLNSQERQTPVIIFSAQDAPPAIAAQVRGVLVKSQTDNEKLMQQIKSAITKKS